MGRYRAGLVGESKYQQAVRRLRAGDPVKLEPEPDNRHDSRAIKAIGPAGETLGYIERDSWLTRCIIDEKGTVVASVKELIGGGRGRSLGVVLDVFTASDAVELMERQEARADPVSGSLMALLSRFFR